MPAPAGNFWQYRMSPLSHRDATVAGVPLFEKMAVRDTPIDGAGLLDGALGHGSRQRRLAKARPATR